MSEELCFCGNVKEPERTYCFDCTEEFYDEGESYAEEEEE